MANVSIISGIPYEIFESLDKAFDGHFFQTVNYVTDYATEYVRKKKIKKNVGAITCAFATEIMMNVMNTPLGMIKDGMYKLFLSYGVDDFWDKFEKSETYQELVK